MLAPPEKVRLRLMVDYPEGGELKARTNRRVRPTRAAWPVRTVESLSRWQGPAMDAAIEGIRRRDGKEDQHRGRLSFFALVSWTSFTRWANFEYRTFDLAYYVQAIWQLVHGRFEVSVEHVPLLGNHVEPIVFLFAPLFLVFRHPLLFVVVQNLALAAMGPIGYGMARRAGFEPVSCAPLKHGASPDPGDRVRGAA